MTSRTLELYTCDNCGTSAEGIEVEGMGPKRWLSLEQSGDLASRLADFCSFKCAFKWSKNEHRKVRLAAFAAGVKAGLEQVEVKSG